jgi:hypothetical protein
MQRAHPALSRSRWMSNPVSEWKCLPQVEQWLVQLVAIVS